MVVCEITCPRCTDDYAHILHRWGAPCIVAMTQITEDHNAFSDTTSRLDDRKRVMYEITCPQCTDDYAHILHRWGAPCIVAMTQITEDHNAFSDTTSRLDDRKRVVYEITCPRCTDDYAHILHRWGAPCIVAMTQITEDHNAFSDTTSRLDDRKRVVYEITCPRCIAWYVGRTSRRLQSRFRKHIDNSGPVVKHLRDCSIIITEEII